MSNDRAVHPSRWSFLIDRRAEVAREWKAALHGVRATADVGRGVLDEHLPALLEQIAGLAERVVRGEPLDRTFEAARTNAPGTCPEAPDVSRLLVEFSALRQSVAAVARGAAADAGGMRALDIAVDALGAAWASCYEEGSRRRVERLAAQRESALGKFESLLAASPVGIAFLDGDLRYLRINEALAAMNGRTPAEHIGLSIFDTLPDLAHILEPTLRHVMTTGEAVLNREFTRPAPNATGEPRTYLATFFPVRGGSGQMAGVGGVVSDITGARRTEEDLLRVQQRMQSILEHTPASIWVKDDSGRIVLANHRLADALGHPYEHIMGRRSEDLLPADLAAQHRAHDLIVTRERRAIEAEETVPAPDGVRTFLSIKFLLPGDPPLVGGIATDISDRKRMEAELRVAISARDKVLAAVSHDLRSPLDTIQLTAAILLSHLGGDQRSRRHLEIIHRSCLRMSHLITDLLDMASIGAGRLSINTKPEPADDVLQEALELHQPSADEKTIALVSRARAAGILIECDRQRVLQVFENLVGNALKFCRAGDTVTLGSERVAGAVRFSVEDTGPGIPAELIAHLFDPYWSGPEARRGVGLGLYIVRGIVERHGGRVEVESTVGNGARFSFTIPLASDRESITPQ